MARKQSEILGLFATPMQARQLEEQRITQAAQRYTDPIAQQIYESTAQLGGGLAGLFGAKPESVRQAERLQNIQKSVDFDPDDLPTYYKTMSKRLIDAGLTQAGVEALKLSQEAETAKKAGIDKTSAMKNFDAYLNLSEEQRLIWDAAQGRILDPDERRRLEMARKEGQVLGEAKAEATLSLPEIESTIDQTQSSIDFLLDEKNQGSVKSIVGINSYIDPLRGTEGYGAVRQYDQLKGQLSLSQYEKLKGAGQITEKELQVASDAITKLDRGLSYKAFIAELKKLRGILNQAKKRAIKKTQVSATRDEIPSTIARPKLRYNPKTRQIEPISE